MTIWPDIRFFKAKEFESPDSPGSGTRMNLQFVYKLDKLREAVKIPLVIHSGYRTPAHNATLKDAKGDSAHCSGRAADIRALTSQTKYRIVEAALRLGFRRIGIGSTFIHIDDDPMKPQDVIWVYPSTERKA